MLSREQALSFVNGHFALLHVEDLPPLSLPCLLKDSKLNFHFPTELRNEYVSKFVSGCEVSAEFLIGGSMVSQTMLLDAGHPCKRAGSVVQALCRFSSKATLVYADKKDLLELSKVTAELQGCPFDASRERLDESYLELYSKLLTFFEISTEKFEVSQCMALTNLSLEARRSLIKAFEKRGYQEKESAELIKVFI